MSDILKAFRIASEGVGGSFGTIRWITEAGALRVDRFHLRAHVANRWAVVIENLDQLIQNKPLAQLVQEANEWTEKRGQESGLIESVKDRWSSRFAQGREGKALDRAYAATKKHNGPEYAATIAGLEREGFTEILSKKGVSTGRYFLSREITGKDIDTAVGKMRENADPSKRAEKRPTFQEYDVDGVKGVKQSKSGSLLFTVYSPNAVHIGPHAPVSPRIGCVAAARKWLDKECGQSHYHSVKLSGVGRIAAGGGVMKDEAFEKLANFVLSAKPGSAQGTALENLIAYKDANGSGWSVGVG